MTLLRYNVDKLERSHAQFRFLARKKEEEKFQQIAYVKNKLEFLYLFDVMTSVCDRVISNQPIFNVP